MNLSDPPKENHIKQANGDYHCRDCGSQILAVIQRRPVWEFPSACAGFGNVAKVEVPYCPKCEPRPSESGPPIMGGV